MANKNTRLLAAVMFTDIEGYTAMMQEDEKKANRQRDRHREVLEERAAEFEGKILHYFGDGALTIFSSTYNAVMCAVKIQRDLTNPGLPLRIGIHVGDITYNKDEVYGDAVNIAARLESLSIPGGILISEKVVGEIKNQPQIKTVSLGSFQLKNVKQPLQIYSVSNRGIDIPSSEEIKAQNAAKTKRVAVLPFVNMSDELGFDYFSDGLTEEIINGLTKMKQLDVTSRTSAFAFKDQNEDIRSIGEKLSVTHVLEGSVRKYKDRIRVTAQLIETEEGFHLWSEIYERHLKDIFEIQDIFCQQILEKFRAGFAAPEKNGDSTPSFSSNQDAFKSYLEGKFQWDKWSNISVRKALQSFNEAINADPQFLKAYTALANCYLYLGVTGQMSARLAFEKAEKNVNQALKIDNYSAEAHAANGLIKALFHHRFKDANDTFSRVFEMDDTDMANPCYFYFLFLNIIGEDEMAIQWMERALEFYPSNAIFNSEMGRAYYCGGRYSEAMEQFNYTLELDSSFLPALNGKGWTYVALEEYKKAHQVFEIYQNLVSQDQKNIPQLVYIAARLGMEDVAKHFLELLQLGDASDSYITTPIDVALIYLGMKKYDEVFFHLQRAVDDKIGKVLFIHSDPVWDEIKQDDRYQKLLNQLNLSDVDDISQEVLTQK